MPTTDSESRPLSNSVVARIVATAPTFADRLASRIPRTLFGIRFCLIAVMAALLLFTISASGYAIFTFARLQATTARLASEDLPGLVGAQRITDTLVSLGEALHRAQSVESAAQHHRSMSDIRARIGQLHGQLDELGAVRKLEGANEPNVIRLHLGMNLDALAEALVRFDAILARRIVMEEAREGLREQIREAYTAYVLAVDDANRQMRALVARTLAIDIPATQSEAQLQQRLDAFQDREMSWLGTTQDLRTDGRELITIANAALAAGEPAALKRLADQASLVTLRMDRYRRLPSTPVVDVLATRTREFTRFLGGDPQQTLLIMRSEELDLGRNAAAAFSEIAETHNTLRKDAARLIVTLGTDTGTAIRETRHTVALASQYLLGFSLMAVLVGLVAIRHTVVGRITRIERLTSSMLQAADEAGRGQPSRIDTSVRAIVHGRGRDEIAAMGDALLVFVKAIAQRDHARAQADRAAQERLRLGEQRLRQIIDLVPHRIFAKDADGRFTLINRAMASFYGMTVEALTGKTDAEVTASPAEAARYRAEDRAVIASGQSKRIPEAFTTDMAGRPRVMCNTKIPFTFSDTFAPGVLVVSEDITERKQAEDREQLARQTLDLLNRTGAVEETIRDITLEIRKTMGIDAVGIRLREGDDFPYYVTNGFSEDFLLAERFLCARDQTGEILRDTQGNPVLECMGGNVLCGRTDPTQPFFTANGSFWSNGTTALLASTTDQDRQARTRNRCNSEGYESVALIPLRSGSEIIGLLQLNDRRPNRFTEESVRFFEGLGASIGIALSRKRLEQERVALEFQLRQQQKLEAIGTLASGVAHEINNPINGILNYAQLIEDTAAPESRAAEFAKEIMHETERVATIVRNLLQFARQEKETHSPARPADIVEQTLSLLRAVLRRDQIALTVDVPENLPSLKCRSQQLQQVLMNLLTNARDALNAKYPGHHEGKTITIRGQLRDHDGHPWLRLTVADQGPGIPPEIQTRIFDPFFTTKPRDKGTGLGLSISHGIVKDHHGRLHFETAPGTGTQFHIDLPVDNGWTVEGK